MGKLVLLLSFLLSARGSLDETVAALSGTTYTAPTLAASPRPSGCQNPKCRALDSVEAQGFDLARAKKIPWTRLVDVFYNRRAELYPDSDDGLGVNELKSYQRALAEQMDLGRLTESQWTYLVEKKDAEITARYRERANARRAVSCTTTSVGTKEFPQFQTACR